MYISDDPIQDAINYIYDCDKVQDCQFEKCEFCLEKTDTPKRYFSVFKRRDVILCETCFNNPKEDNELAAKYLKR